MNSTRREKKTFPLFAKLPAEIRLRIWRYNLPEPNALTAMYDESSMRADQSRTATWVFMNKIKYPFVNLQICQESRFEAIRSRHLESYESLHLCNHSERAWFNRNTDTYFIDTNVEGKDRIFPPDLLISADAGTLYNVSFFQFLPKNLRFLGISAHILNWPFEETPWGARYPLAELYWLKNSSTV